MGVQMKRILFGDGVSSRSNRSKAVSQGHSGKPHTRARELHMENLEERALLSVSPLGDAQDVVAAYSDFQIAENANFIEVTDLTADSLRAAIQQAAQTTVDDVVVVRTTATANSIALDGSALVFDVDSDLYGSITLVGWGDTILTLSNTQENVALVRSGNVNFGGISFLGLESEGQSFQTDGLVAVSDGATAAFARSMWAVEDLTSVATGSKFASSLITASDDAALTTSVASNSYDATVNISGTKYAYITGLSQADYNQLQTWTYTGTIAGEFIDAEKGSAIPNSSEQCWSAATANILWYTRWANPQLKDSSGKTLFSGEDDVFRYFTEHFTNIGSAANYASKWFISGNYEQAGQDGWAQLITDGGGFYPTVNASNVCAYYSADSVGNVNFMTSRLKSDYGIVLSIGRFDAGGSRTGGHSITGWGYVYDTSYATSDASYYQSLLVSDSDNDKDSAASGPSALNTLSSLNVTWDTTKGLYHLTDYSGGQFFLEGFTTLAPLEKYVDTVQVSTQDGGVLSSMRVPHGDTVRLTEIPVSNVGYDDISSYQVKVYASTDANITSGDKLLATLSGSSLAAGGTASLSTDIDTSQLSASTTYYIGWILDVSGNADSATTTGVCSSTLQVLADRPAAPTLVSVESTGFHSVDVTLTGVDGISSYILYYSTNSSFTNAQSVTVSAGKTSLTGLNTGNYYFRAVSVLSNDVVSLNSNMLQGSTYTKGVRTENGATLSSTRVPKGDTFSISNVSISNFGIDNSGTYRIRYYASTDTTIGSDDDILLVEVPMSNLTGGNTTYAAATLSSSSLAADESYYIGWVLDVTGNQATNAETVGYCETKLTTLSSRPAAPTLSATAVAIDQINVTLSSAESGVTYKLEYSTDSSFANATVIDNAQAGVNEVTGLKTGTKYYFRAMAVLTEEVTSRYSDTCDATTFLLSVSTRDGCKISTTRVDYGKTFTVSGINVVNDGQVNAESFQINVYAVPTIDTAHPIQVGTITVDSLNAGASTTVQLEVDSSLLNSGNAYYFTWTLALDNNWSSSVRGSNTSDSVIVAGKMLDATRLELGTDPNPIGSTTVQLLLSEVENASYYYIEYADNTDFENKGSMNSDTAGLVTVTGLVPETTYYFRATAKGSGAYEDSYRSNVLIATTDITPFDLATQNGGELYETTVLYGDYFNLEQVVVRNLSNSPSNPGKLLFYASQDTTFDKDTDILVGTENLAEMAGNESVEIGVMLDSTALEIGKSYYIFWEISATAEIQPNNNVGYCSTPISVQALPLNSFTLRDPDVEYKVHNTVWTEIDPNDATVTYQWYRGTSPDNITTAISGATKPYYQISRADVGCYVKCVVSGTGRYATSTMSVTVPNVIASVEEFDLETTADTGTQILSTNAVTYGETFTVSNVPITNVGNIASSGFTIRYYASKDTNITSADILLGSYKLPALDVGEMIVDDTHTFYTDQLTSGVTYRIGWLIAADSTEYNTSNNTAIAGVLAVNKLAIETPTLTLVKTAAKSVTLRLSEVEHAASYVIQYSTSPNFSKYSTYTASVGNNRISLAASTQYYFRAYAVGETNYGTSGYSEVIAAATTMYVPDLMSPTPATLTAESPLVPGSSFNVSNLVISNIGGREATTYTIKFYAAEENIFVDENPDISSAILLGTVEKGELYSLPETGTIRLTQTLNSAPLDYEKTYYVGWYLETANELNLSNNWGYCEQTLTTSKRQNLELTPVIVTEKSGPASVVIPSSTETIDEWTAFSLELWSNDGMGNAEQTITYDSSLFTLEDLEAPEEFHVVMETTGTEGSLVTLTLTATPEVNTVGSGENVLAARLNFTPNAEGGIAATLANKDGVSNWCMVNDTYLATTVTPYLYDLDDNGVVNLNDLLLFSDQFGADVRYTPEAALVDYDSNGVVNLNDLLLFSSHFQTSLLAGETTGTPSATTGLKAATTAMVPISTTVTTAIPAQTVKKELAKYDSYQTPNASMAASALSAVFAEEQGALDEALEDAFDLLENAETQSTTLSADANDFWSTYGENDD